MTRRRALGAGFLAGFVAGLLMTVTMLLLAWLFGVATPLVIFGDRLSVFIPADTFLSLMGRVGGYNHMKQLGVGSVIAGQLFVGGLGGLIYGLVMRRSRAKQVRLSPGFIFFLLPLVVAAFSLAGPRHALSRTADQGRDRRHPRRLVRGVSSFSNARSFSSSASSRAPRVQINDQEFSPPIGRRALLASGLALLAAGGGAELLRRLYQRRDLQLRRHAIQRPDRSTDHA